VFPEHNLVVLDFAVVLFECVGTLLPLRPAIAAKLESDKRAQVWGNSNTNGAGVIVSEKADVLNKNARCVFLSKETQLLFQT